MSEPEDQDAKPVVAARNKTVTGRSRKLHRDLIETDLQQLRRSQAGHRSAWDQFITPWRRFWYGSSFYRMRLRSSYPLKLQVAPADLWQGDAARGSRLLEGRLTNADTDIPIDAIGPAVVAPPDWLAWMHSFLVLRDLAASGVDSGSCARITERLAKAWLKAYDRYDPFAWRADILGQRLMSWVGHAPFLLSSSDHVYRSAILTSMGRQATHLAHQVSRTSEGLACLRANVGLIWAGLALPGREAYAEKAMNILEQRLPLFIMADGGVSTRCPQDMLESLRLLLSARAIYQARGMDAPMAIVQTMDRLIPALRGLSLGDGVLSSWNGGGTGAPTALAEALSLIDRPPAALKNAVHSGFQRVEGGRSVFIMDTGPPPSGRLSDHAHAGTLAFEFADGPQRLVVNCGSTRASPSPLPEALLTSLRATAAHSTLTLNDANSTPIGADGLLGKGVEQVTVVRRENEDGSWIDAAHDGYVRRFGMIHRRRLFLSADGVDMRGEDALEPKGRNSVAGLAVCIRFHLAAGVAAIPTQGQTGAALKLPNGTAWMFRCKGATLEIADSLTIANDGRTIAARRTQQLVLTAMAAPEGAVINWSFARSVR